MFGKALLPHAVECMPLIQYVSFVFKNGSMPHPSLAVNQRSPDMTRPVYSRLLRAGLVLGAFSLCFGVVAGARAHQRDMAHGGNHGRSGAFSCGLVCRCSARGVVLEAHRGSRCVVETGPMFKRNARPDLDLVQGRRFQHARGCVH